MPEFGKQSCIQSGIYRSIYSSTTITILLKLFHYYCHKEAHICKVVLVLDGWCVSLSYHAAESFVNCAVQCTNFELAIEQRRCLP